jgi:hypothetical protein
MYGFEIKAKQNVVEMMAKVEKAMTQMAEKVDKSTKKAEESMEKMGDTARKVGERMAEIFAVREIYEFGKELMNTAAEFETFANVIKYSSKDMIDAGDNLDYISGAVTRLHLPMKEAYQGFSELQAGLIGTGIEGEKLRKMFEGITTAATVLHLPKHALEMVLYDFKEIGERGLNMRNMRSLTGWLPGINAVVKETFHKSFEELEKEGLSGAYFLDKLSGGLQKHFAPGLPNAGHSLQAQINDMGTSFTRLKLEMGDNLRPVFTEIFESIHKAFDSGPVRAFVQNIRPIAETMLSLGKIWVEYKIGVFAAEAAMKGYAAALELVAGIQALVGVETEALAVSMKTLTATAFATGIGVMAVAIGMLVDNLIEANNKLDDFVEKTIHVKELAGSFDANKKKSDDIMLAMSGNLTGQEKSEALVDLNTQIEALHKVLDTKLNPSIAAGQDQIKKAYTYELDPTTGKPTGTITDPKYLRLFEGLQGLQFEQRDYTRQLTNLERQRDKLLKAGVKPPSYNIPKFKDGMENGALSLVGMAGAKGGLAEAKVIHIEFHDALQKIALGVPSGIKRAGQDGIEVMLRALNNIAYGQSRTQ